MRGSERRAGTTTSKWCLGLARLSGPCSLRSKTLSPSRSKRTSCTRYHARVERSTSERPRDASEPGSRNTKTPALNARPTSQRSPNMLGQRTTPSTGVVRRSCSVLTMHTMELVMKEALCIQSTQADSRFNRDGGYELPDHLVRVESKVEGRSHRRSPRAAHRTHAQHYIIT